MSKTLPELIENFTEESIEKNESTELLFQLKEKPEATEELRDNLYLESLIGQSEKGEDSFTENLLKEIQKVEEEEKNAPTKFEAPSRSKVTQAKGKKKTKSSSSQPQRKQKVDFTKYLVWLGVAAAFIVAFIFLSKPKSNLLVNTIDGQAQITRDGQTLYLVPGEAVFKGDKIVSTKGKTTLAFNTENSSISLPEGTTIVIGYPAEEQSQNKSIEVLTGKAEFNIQHQQAGQSMQVTSKAANVTVLGTDFHVGADDSSSTIEVNKGEVRILNNASDDQFDLPEKYGTTLSGKDFPEIKSLGKIGLPKVLSFSLIEPQSDKVLQKYINMQSGSEISLADLTEEGYNLRANVANASIVKHVKFTLTNNAGKTVMTRIENKTPYTMVGGLKNSQITHDFDGTKAVPGTYILTANVYTPKSGAPVYSAKFKFKIK
ncbi:MAG: FecR family protein [Lentisphaeraceae bacterium]|nr:FecR family protein [Lentisphaeraceae bacterium]